MKCKFFKVSALNPMDDEQLFNQFCHQHRIVNTEKHFVANGDTSFWSLCVSYLESAEPVSSKKTTVDYKEVLSEEDFAIFAELRELRKNIANAEAIPVYAIFTNQQLAAMVENRVLSKSAMQTIEGIGQGRINKYADAFINLLKVQFASSNPTVTL